jgi:hypothetical protein
MRHICILCQVLQARRRRVFLVSGVGSAVSGAIFQRRSFELSSFEIRPPGAINHALAQ